MVRESRLIRRPVAHAGVEAFGLIDGCAMI
jgi:hypothetical protein